MKKGVKKIRVKLKNNPYTIFISDHLVKSIPSHIRKLNLGNFGIIITSPKVYSLYKSLINKTFKKSEYKVVVAADGEKVKSKEWLFKVIGQIVKSDSLNRKVFLVCLGGGTIGDLGGFAASVYKRGAPYVQIPTTLLAQVDASIGGKTAIDLKEAKNIVGSFHQPKAVFIDPVFLHTLPPKEFREGMAEVIKYGVIRDKNFFNFLKKNHKKVKNLAKAEILKVLNRCAQIKADIVEKDEKESKGIRTILNFGHTFAHAFEAGLKYKKISHGEAVSVGMICAGYLSYILDKSQEADAEKIKELIKLFSLPTKISFDHNKVYKALCYDKKFIRGKIRLVLLKKIGKVEVLEGISTKVVRSFLKILATSD